MKRKRPVYAIDVARAYKKRRLAGGRPYTPMVRSRKSFVRRSYGNPLAISETKYFDADRDLTAIQNVAGASWANTEQDPATLNCLFAPSQGNDYNNREGRKCYVKAIKMRGYINCLAQTDATTADGAAFVRLIVYMDKQTNATFSQGEDVIASGSATLNTVASFQNPANFGRFRVLKDKIISLEAKAMSYDGTNMEQAGLMRPFKVNIKFRKPLLIHFNATNGGTVADIVDNSFHVIAATSSAALAPNIVYKSRVVFCE